MCFVREMQVMKYHRNQRRLGVSDLEEGMNLVNSRGKEKKSGFVLFF